MRLVRQELREAVEEKHKSNGTVHMKLQYCNLI